MKRFVYFAASLLVLSLLGACNEIDNYLPNSGRLYIQLENLPLEADAGVVIVGPDRFEDSIDTETTLTELEEGSYTVTADPVVYGGVTYSPDPDQQRAEVARNETTTVVITYR